MSELARIVEALLFLSPDPLPVDALADAGEVDVVRGESGEATYRRCGSGGHHHHLVCRGCGAAVEVAAPQLERGVATVARDHGYAATEHTLEISATCRRCAGG